MDIGWLVFGEPPQPNPPYVDQWGLIRDEQDFGREYERIQQEIEQLRNQGYTIRGGDVVRGPDDVWNLSSEYAHRDLLVVYGVSGGGRGARRALMSYGVPLIMVSKIRERDLYGHALFQQWFSRDAMKDFPEVSLVGDTEELIDQLEAHRAVHELRNTRVLCVGEPNDFFEGKIASRRAQNRFGISIDYLSFERFKQRLESVEPEDEDVRAIRDDFLGKPPGSRATSRSPPPSALPGRASFWRTGSRKGITTP